MALVEDKPATAWASDSERNKTFTADLGSKPPTNLLFHDASRPVVQLAHNERQVTRDLAAELDQLRDVRVRYGSPQYAIQYQQHLLRCHIAAAQKLPKRSVELKA